MRFTVPCNGIYTEKMKIFREYTVYGKILTICEVIYTETIENGSNSGGSETAIFIDGMPLPSNDILDALDNILQSESVSES